MAVYNVFYNKNATIDLKKFKDIVAFRNFYFQVSKSSAFFDSNYGRFFLVPQVEAQNEEEALNKVLQRLESMYFDLKPSTVAEKVLRFLKELHFYEYKKDERREKFKAILEKNYPDIVSVLKNRKLQNNKLSGYVNTVKNLTNIDFTINPLLDKLIVQYDNFMDEFVTSTGQSVDAVFLKKTPVLAIHHSDYQKCSYYDLIDYLKRFEDEVYLFYYDIENYFDGGFLKIPNGKDVYYSLIETDNGVKFLSLDQEGSHRNFFVNLLSEMVFLPLKPDNPVEIKKFEFNKFVKLNDNLNALKEKYSNLDIIDYSSLTSKLTFYISQNRKSVSVSLNELISRDADYLNREYFNASLLNKFAKTLKKSLKRF